MRGFFYLWPLFYNFLRDIYGQNIQKIRMPIKILIIRFSSIGDIVLTTPVMRCLRQKFGVDADTHYICKDSFTTILSENPYINKLHSYQKNDEKAIIQQLKAEKFDVVLDLQNNWRSMRIRWAISAPKSYVFSKLNVRKWWLTQFKIDILPASHVVERYMQTVAPLGVTYDGLGLDYFIPKSAEISLFDYANTDFWAAYPTAVAIAIGAAHGTKQIPTTKIIEIAQILAEKGKAVVLLGGKEDIEKAKTISASGETLPITCGAVPINNIINLVGQISLHSSADILRQVAAVIAPDTGLMHIAAALRCKLISVWGSTVPKFGMSPFYPDGLQSHMAIVENKSIACRPCSKLGYPSCPKTHFNCMMQIEAAEIVKLIDN